MLRAFAYNFFYILFSVALAGKSQVYRSTGANMVCEVTPYITPQMRLS